MEGNYQNRNLSLDERFPPEKVEELKGDIKLHIEGLGCDPFDFYHIRGV